MVFCQFYDAAVHPAPPRLSCWQVGLSRPCSSGFPQTRFTRGDTGSHSAGLVLQGQAFGGAHPPTPSALSLEAGLLPPGKQHGLAQPGGT